MSKTYPELGSVVSYARADEAGAIHTGSGKVQAIFVHADRRAMVQVRDGDSAWNIDLAMINATPEKVAEYSAAIVEIKDLENRGNALVRDTVASFNDKVDAVYQRVLGDFIEMELPKVVKAEDGQDQTEAA